MNLDVSNWKPFKICEIFDSLQNGKANQTLLDEGDDCIYIGAKRDDNGVMFRCAYNAKLVQNGNCVIFITNGEGSVGYANYMSEKFIGTIDIVAGYGKHINEYTGPFIATLASLERPRYSYGRKWKKSLRNTIINLPVDTNNEPDWQFMEDYMKSLHSKKISTKNKCSDTSKLNVCDWKDFNIGELFYSIKKGRKFNKEDLEEVDVSVNYVKYITRTAENNGCEWFVADLPYDGLEAGNAITIGDTTATCFYQKDEFICGDHMVVLRADWLNEYTGLFITTLLNNEQYKYNYGRAFKMDLIQSTVLRLPVTLEGNPDWQFMEDYIKSLPYGDRI